MSVKSLAVAPSTNSTDENPFEVQARVEMAKPKNGSPSIIRGKRVRPIFTVLYGGPGIGKTSWAAQAPAAIFLDIERGCDQVGADRFDPVPKTFEEFNNQLQFLDKEPHDYKTIVVDTADALQALIFKRVCLEKKVKSIEEVGWQDGYKRAVTIWRGTLGQIRDMSERFNMVVLAHAHIKSFTDPALTAPYDTWKINLHDLLLPVLREMCDNILFAAYDVEIVKENRKAARGLHSGERIVRTVAGTGFDAKNRFNLPDPMPLEWSALENGVREFYGK